MEVKDQSVIGLFSDRSQADGAVVELKNLGYSSDDISVVVKVDSTASQETETDDAGSNVAKGAVTGATTGAAVGALAGLLVGIGAITVPGVGALLIGGPIASALGLTGAAAATVSGATSGVVAGGLIGGLAGLGMSQEEAQVYETRLNEGAIMLAVPIAVSLDDARIVQIFENNGADEIKIVSGKVAI
jgi:hypothetical protein